MSLLSTDITKLKRLSLKEVKLPAPQQRVEPITPIQVERPPTGDEVAYSKLVAINPLIEDLVERLELVSITGDRVNKLELIKEDLKAHPPLEVKPINTERLQKQLQRLNKTKGVIITERTIKFQGGLLGATDEEIEIVIAKLLPKKENDKSKLIALAQRVIEGESSYTMEEIVERIKQATNVNKERAEIGFKLILQAGAIEQTINPGLYYLKGSTPF
jgi:hypothetical protein